MTDLAQKRDPGPQGAPSPTAGQALLRGLRDDRVLLGAFVVCGVLIGYQVTVTLLQPPWIKPTTDWLRTALAWPQFIVVGWIILRLLRVHRFDVLAWCFAALGMLSYAVARTTWTIADIYIYPHGVPYPSLPDLFFILQYAFFLTTLVVSSELGPWRSRLRASVDAVMFMTAVSALLWYFVFDRIAGASGESQASKTVSMTYQIVDLAILYGLVIALTRPRRTVGERLFEYLMYVAFACLLVADTWAAVLLTSPPHVYRTGGPPDVFWFTFYLLVPLACLVRLRVMPTERPREPVMSAEHPRWHDLLASIQFTLPTLAVVASSAVIIVGSTAQHGLSTLTAPAVIGFGLLALAAIRPALLYLDQLHLQRERADARAQEAALRAANQRMEEFISIASHELKTPLTVLVGNVQLLARRLDVLLGTGGSPDDTSRALAVLRSLVDSCERSLQRMGRLVEDLLDVNRIVRGRLALRMGPFDLTTVVGAAVEDQALIHPERRIYWEAGAGPVPVVADAERIQQVVANYLSNALKFSREDQAVEVRLAREDGRALVSVRDEGIGLPVAEQARVWERFHQAAGTPVQSDSQIGLGLGLYINRTIIEQHQGQVGVESKPGQGTTFWFSLPLASHNR